MSSNKVFLSFTQYDFDNDDRFKAGVSSIMKNQEGSKDEVLEKAKWFYYTKFMEAFDFDDYQQWKKDNMDKEGHATTKAETAEEEVINNKTESIEYSITTTVDGERVPVPPKLTFQEITEMIETGQEIPGIRTIPNKLNEGKPSQPQMKTRPKPWEQQRKTQQD
ncbi:hypothetical protein BC941DRAFT_474070 [Chlamydoabsidia padenii]|nr:hypothetical protein BC941DRAFT_474070 [Chlamydoabsidia padenii]